MRILHTETLKKWGGQQNRVLSEASGLSRRGHEVVIACNRGSVLAGRAQAEGIPVYELEMEKMTIPRNVMRLAEVIRRHHIEIVATHSSVDSWTGGFAALLTGRKLVRFRHNLYPIGRDPLTRFIYRIPDRIIAISGAVRDALVVRGIRAERITVIHSSVDPARFAPGARDLRGELGLPQDALVIGNTSTFTRVKGPELLLRAFNRICREYPCYLLLAGRLNDVTRERHLALVDPELRERVILPGHRDDVAAVLATLDLFVYPSFLEGLGTALLEAMTMERPVAVTDIPTFRSFIRDGDNGVFFRADDPDDIAAKVVTLLRDAGLRARIASQARQTAIDLFSLEGMVDRTERLYREVLHV